MLYSEKQWTTMVWKVRNDERRRCAWSRRDAEVVGAEDPRMSDWAGGERGEEPLLCLMGPPCLEGSSRTPQPLTK